MVWRYTIPKGRRKRIETKDVIYELRTGKGLSQEELAEKDLSEEYGSFTRFPDLIMMDGGRGQVNIALTVPNTETLKLLSALFDVSINTLLGTPRQLICQCCGMPLEDGITSREPDGSYNEDYCKWCYAEGAFAYQSKDALLDFLLAHMPNSENIGEAERRAQYDAHLSQLKHWK